MFIHAKAAFRVHMGKISSLHLSPLFVASLNLNALVAAYYLHQLRLAQRDFLLCLFQFHKDDVERSMICARFDWKAKV